jgi:hypothetical protein
VGIGERKVVCIETVIHIIKMIDIVVEESMEKEVEEI